MANNPYANAAIATQSIRPTQADIKTSSLVDVVNFLAHFQLVVTSITTMRDKNTNLYTYLLVLDNPTRHRLWAMVHAAIPVTQSFSGGSTIDNDAVLQQLKQIYTLEESHLIDARARLGEQAL